MMHSLGGGTGSGFGSLLIDKLSQEYSDKILFNFSVYPGSATHANIVIENPALYNICTNLLKVKSPTFGDLNHVIA